MSCVSSIRFRCFVALFLVAISVLVCVIVPYPARRLVASLAQPSWSEDFSVVQIRSSSDGSIHNAYAYKSPLLGKKPLIVSLHPWTGNFERYDPLSSHVLEVGYNYIHPDFRGPNNSPSGCASVLALSDIDDAISYCLENWSVDVERIYVVGASGGGHAACATYLRSVHPIRACFAWVPITDVEAWYYQSQQRGLSYASDIEKVCGGRFDPEIARSRSPIYMNIGGEFHGNLHLFAGVEDGYSGSVPISHSILMFNRLCEASGEANLKLEMSDVVSLLTRAVECTGQEIGERAVFFKRSNRLGTLTVFDGGHEMLPGYTVDSIVKDAASAR